MSWITFSDPADSRSTLLQENKKMREFNARIMKEVRSSRIAKAEMERTAEKYQREATKWKIEASVLKADISTLQKEMSVLENELQKLRTSSSYRGDDVSAACDSNYNLVVAQEASSWESIKRLAQLFRPTELLSGLTPSVFKPLPTITAPLPATTKDYTIILDLDETQMHFSIDRHPSKKVELRFRPGTEVALQQFCRLRDKAEFGLWTAGVPRYAASVRELLTMLAKENEIFDWTLARDVSWSSGCGYKKATVHVKVLFTYGSWSCSDY
eukprot:TRINITY_DN1707_c1_g1_i2.p1 TRINITY_DN1707_c1_g1~~TRINITY_DN1707_c1_g1_i2.p1  ORF type:complete len:270 (+),score=40.35 TRINITY_DN1707_c1_g1_i2:58-867(+)